MSRVDFAAVLKWSPQNERDARDGIVSNQFGFCRGPLRPAPWPVCMAAQRLAFQHGPAEAYLRLFGPDRKVAA